MCNCSAERLLWEGSIGSEVSGSVSGCVCRRSTGGIAFAGCGRSFRSAPGKQQRIAAVSDSQVSIETLLQLVQQRALEVNDITSYLFIWRTLKCGFVDFIRYSRKGDLAFIYRQD